MEMHLENFFPKIKNILLEIEKKILIELDNYVFTWKKKIISLYVLYYQFLEIIKKKIEVYLKIITKFLLKQIKKLYQEWM